MPLLPLYEQMHVKFEHGNIPIIAKVLSYRHINVINPATGNPYPEILFHVVDIVTGIEYIKYFSEVEDLGGEL